MLTNSIGPLLIGLAAFLWATDALFRFPAIKNIDPTFIVFIEHVIVVLALLPWVLWKHRKQILALSGPEWLSAIFSGIGGSAIATVFFTASFLYVNPSIAVLLQKIQPILVVIIAYLFLGERPVKKFYFWGFIALLAAIVLSFPDFDFQFLENKMNFHALGIKYTLGAAFLWAASTVSGKILLKRTPPSLATFWRFFFGLIALAVLLGTSNMGQMWSQLNVSSSLFGLMYLSLIPGLLAMLVYYTGLSKTPATVSTFIELLYPIGAVALNTVFLHTPLNPVQTIAGAVLIFAVVALSL